MSEVLVVKEILVAASIRNDTDRRNMQYLDVILAPVKHLSRGQGFLQELKLTFFHTHRRNPQLAI